jgi:hypothetical protein
MKTSMLTKITSVGGAALLAAGSSGAVSTPTSARIEPNWEYPASTESFPISETVEESAKSTLRQSDRVLEHFNYLVNVSKPEKELISRATAKLAAKMWIDCWSATGYALPVPAACTGPDGQMHYSWDREQHHLELEITLEEVPTFFYRNRETGELWMEECAADGLPAGAVQKLKLFV